MGFASGSVTFRRFVVIGQGPSRVDEAMIEKLAAKGFGADDLRTADHTEYGWITGEHLLDVEFNLLKNAIADGLFCAMRIDVNKPPADLVRSYIRQNEQVALEASGREFLSKAEKRAAREKARDQAEREARAGAFRRTKQVPVFWDLRRGEVYMGSSSQSLAEMLMLLFGQTFDLTLVPVTAGELAARWASAAGESRSFDDSRPAVFVQPPEGSEAADQVGAAANEQAKDFLGVEFLTWVWYVTAVESPQITTQIGQSVTVMIEKAMQMDCAFKLTGKLAISADDPVRLPEAGVALAGGKLPVKAGLQVAAAGETFGLSLRPDLMSYGSLVLPAVEDASTPRNVFEERIDHLRDLIEGLDMVFHAFLRRRLSSRWTQTLNAMRAWAAAAGREPTADLRAAASAS